MTEEKARADAEALVSALGIAFYVVKSQEGNFSAVQLPSEESEIVATIEPLGEKHSLDGVAGDGVAGFGQPSPQD
jgi:hypothetical protein